MSRTRLNWIEKEIRRAIRKSREECGDELEHINRLLVRAIAPFSNSYVKCCFGVGEKRAKREYYSTLAEKCFMDLVRTSNQILALSYSGLYRNAFDSIRYILESIVLAVYIDTRHPNADLETRIEIFSEVEDKREYHAIRLIDELEIDYKDLLRREYKRLSQIIHPSHEQVLEMIDDFMDPKGGPFPIYCERIEEIHDSMRRMYEIFYFLFIPLFPGLKEALQNNQEFIEFIKNYNQVLLSKVFKVRPRKSPK